MSINGLLKLILCQVQIGIVINIIHVSLTCYPSLICGGVADLRKSHYESHARDSIYVQANETGDCKHMKILLKCFACYENWNQSKLVFIISLYNHDTYCKYFHVLSSFMTYHPVCNQSITTGATSGAGTAYPFRAPEFTPGFQWGSCCLIFSFMCSVWQIIACPLSFGQCFVCP